MIKRFCVLLLLTGCTRVDPPIRPPASDTCDAGRYQSLVGQDATALEKVLIMRMVRVIRPGDAVTKDFRPTRINFDVDADNVIADIWCG